MLEDAARTGGSVIVNWKYHEDNDTALECGETFQEDLENVAFNLVALESKYSLEGNISGLFYHVFLF